MGPQPPPPPKVTTNFNLLRYGGGKWSQLDQLAAPSTATHTLKNVNAPAAIAATRTAATTPAYWSGSAFGPLADWSIPESPAAGWAVDSGSGKLWRGQFSLQGDSRAMLVHDHTAANWASHKYVRFDLAERPIRFTLDLSNVPCGCLACLYFVAAKEPDASGSNYCDMAENVKPGYGGGTCYEIDLLEANNNAMQSAIHTQLGGTIGSGQCDRNGCFQKTGGPMALPGLGEAYGPGKTIDSMRPFDVSASVSPDGGLEVKLIQGSNIVRSFDPKIAGNPQGHGVPSAAKTTMLGAMGKLALVASLWSASDTSWLDGPSCSQCRLSSASFSISNLVVEVPSPPPPPAFYCFMPACTSKAYNHNAGESTCAQRVDWLMAHGYENDEKAACIKVATEFPGPCGKCLTIDKPPFAPWPSPPPPNPSRPSNCANWCDLRYAENHCQDGSCRACGFCQPPSPPHPPPPPPLPPPSPPPPPHPPPPPPPPPRPPHPPPSPNPPPRPTRPHGCDEWCSERYSSNHCQDPSCRTCSFCQPPPPPREPLPPPPPHPLLHSQTTLPPPPSSTTKLTPTLHSSSPSSASLTSASSSSSHAPTSKLAQAVDLAAQLTHTDPKASRGAYELLGFVVVSVISFSLLIVFAWVAMGMYGWALIKPQIMRKFNWRGSSKGGGKYATLPRGGEGGAGAAAHAEHEDVFDHEQPILPSPPRPPLQPPQPSMMRAQPPPRASLLPSYQPAAHHPPTPQQQQQQWVSATSLPPYPMPAVAAVPPPIAPHQIMPPLEAVPSLGEGTAASAAGTEDALQRALREKEAIFARIQEDLRRTGI